MPRAGVAAPAADAAAVVPVVPVMPVVPVVPIVRWRDADGTPREERTERPAEFVASVVAEHGGEPDALEVIRPSLEDIYLRLVHAAGAEVRDDEEALA